MLRFAQHDTNPSRWRRPTWGEVQSAGSISLKVALAEFDKLRPWSMMPNRHGESRGGSTMTRLAARQTPLTRREIDAADQGMGAGAARPALAAAAGGAAGDERPGTGDAHGAGFHPTGSVCRAARRARRSRGRGAGRHACGWPPSARRRTWTNTSRPPTSSPPLATAPTKGCSPTTPTTRRFPSWWPSIPSARTG